MLCTHSRFLTFFHIILDEESRVTSRGGRTSVPHHSHNVDASAYLRYFPKGEKSFVKHKLPKLCKIVPPNTFGKSPSAYLWNKVIIRTRDEFESNNPSKSRFLSRKEFVTLVARRGDITRYRFIRTCKLHCHFVFHCYSRIEADRLSSIGMHHTEIRSCSASSLFKHFYCRLNDKGINLVNL